MSARTCQRTAYGSLLVLATLSFGATSSYGATASGGGRIAVTAQYFPLGECDPPLPDRRCVTPSSHLWTVQWPSREAVFGREDVNRIVTARNGSVAFVRYRSRIVDGEQVVEPSVYVADGLRAPARFLAEGDEPAWSPDSKRVAFVRNASIWIVRRSGTGARRLTAGGNPAWSPSRRIAFSTSIGRCRLCIATMDPSGRRRRQVSQGPRDFDPAWSPHATRLAYVAEGARSGGAIAIIRRDGTGRRRLEEGFDPTWSPDGRRIAMHRGNRVYAMRADGSRLRSVIDVDTLYPSGPPAGSEEVLLGVSEWRR